MTTASRSTPSLRPILAVAFVGSLGFSIVLPFLVYLVTRLGGNAVIYGVVGATYSAFQLVGAPILGRWSDRVGRKRVLLVSQLGTLASWGTFLVALAIPVHVVAEVESPLLGAFTLTVPLLVLVAARALDGLTGGNVSVANAYLADITPEEERSANFGRLALWSNLGFILGPAIAGILGATGAGEWLPVLAAFLISVVATLVIAVALHDPEPCELDTAPESGVVRDVLGGDQKECYRVEGEERLSGRQILALPSVVLLLGLQFLVFLAFNFYYVAFPVHAATGLEWTLTELGIFFTVLGLLMAVVQGPVLGRLSRRVDDRSLVIVGSLVLAAGFVAFTGRKTAVVYAGLALIAAGNGVMWPSLLAVLSKATDRSLQGAVQGFSGSVTAVASIAGLLGGGLLYGVLGARVFLVSGAIAAGVFLLAFRVDGSTGQAAEPSPSSMCEFDLTEEGVR